MKKKTFKDPVCLKDKIILAHRGWSSARAKGIYRENSLDACVDSSSDSHISIIELDVRKSQDGEIYCYHGGSLEYLWLKFFPPSIKKAKDEYRVDTLREILGAIDPRKTIFIDLKDTSITRSDILRAFNGFKFKEVILGHWSVSFLSRFKNMPEEFVKIMNGNIFCNFYDLRKLKEDNYKYFEVVFPFQIRKGIMNKVKQAGLEFRFGHVFFCGEKQYWKKVRKYNIKHITSDFM